MWERVDCVDLLRSVTKLCSVKTAVKNRDKHVKLPRIRTPCALQVTNLYITLKKREPETGIVDLSVCILQERQFVLPVCGPKGAPNL